MLSVMLPPRVIELPPSVKVAGGGEGNSVEFRARGKVVVGREPSEAVEDQRIVGNWCDAAHPVERRGPIVVVAVPLQVRSAAKDVDVARTKYAATTRADLARRCGFA